MKLIKCLMLVMVMISTNIFAQEKPNIVFIFSDDAGYADFGFHGSSEMPTPNLDKLANQGMLFKQAYVTAAVCGPSRAGLLTGKYQQRFGYEENNVPAYMDNAKCMHDDDMGLPLDQVTMGDYMKDLGYATGYFGKWHLGGTEQFHPCKRGFDTFVGFRGGARSFWDYEDPSKIHTDNLLEWGMGKFEEPQKYLTDLLTDEAIKFIEHKKDSNFFLFLAYNAVHAPMEAEQADLDQFPNLEGTRKILAAMNLSMDRNIGRFMDKLDELGLSENTLVVFTNDNGGPSDHNASVNDPLSGTKANHLEGGIRVPFLLRWPGVVDAKTTFDYPISTLDLLPTFYVAAGGDISDLHDIDGVNLKPYITGVNEERPHELLYWKKENRGVVREGDWKLLRFPDRPAELYNLADDISEKNNLASNHPEKVKAMYKKLFEWECTLARPQWQLQRIYEKKAMERMDAYRK